VSVCLSRLFSIVLMKLKHLLVSSSFIRPTLYCLSVSLILPLILSLPPSVCLSPLFMRCLHIFSLIQWLCSLSVCVLSLSILPLISLSHYIDIYSIFRTNSKLSFLFALSVSVQIHCLIDRLPSPETYCAKVH